LVSNIGYFTFHTTIYGIPAYGYSKRKRALSGNKKKRAQVSLTRAYSHEATLMPLWHEPCLRNLRLLLVC
jgi:hypothetical protein